MLAAMVAVAGKVSRCQVNSAGAHKQQSDQQQDPPDYNQHLSGLAYISGSGALRAVAARPDDLTRSTKS